MKRFAITSFVLALTTAACGEKAPAPTPAPEAAKVEAAKPEDKPAEAKPAEAPKAEAQPAEAPKAEAQPAEPAGGAEKPAEDLPAAAKGWDLFEDKDGTFKIHAPGKPNTMPQEAETELGKVTYINHMFSIPDGMLMVGWADMPLDPKDVTAEVEKKMFDGGRDGMIKAINAKLIEEKVIEVDGFPGRAYLMEFEVPGHGQAQNHVRTFLAGNRHYTLQGLGMGSGSKEAQLAFLDTFHITKAKTAPVGEAAPAGGEAPKGEAAPK